MINIQQKDAYGNPADVHTNSDIVEIVNANPIYQDIGGFKAGDNINGLSLTDFINVAFCGKFGTFEFLHMSDLHGETEGVTKAKELMQRNPNIKFAYVTGDISEPTISKIKEITSPETPFLVLAGNHDTDDTYSKSQVGCRNGMVYAINPQATFPSSVASYWHYDVKVNGYTIRIISTDIYERDTVGMKEVYGATVSQAQVDWFINLLKTTPDDYYIITASHIMMGGGYMRDLSNLNNMSQSKLPDGTSILSIPKDDRDADVPIIFSDIVKAWKHNDTLNKTYSNGVGNIVVNTNFADCNQAKFLMHLSGHCHWDICETLFSDSNYLQMCIASETGVVNYDLAKTDAKYAINNVSVDFRNEKIKVERIGARLKNDGTLRTGCEFDFTDYMK